MPAETNGGAGTRDSGPRHMSADHDDRTPSQKILEEIAAIPAILVFPPEIFTQLDELCELRGFTHHQLVVEAALSLQGQGARRRSWKKC